MAVKYKSNYTGEQQDKDAKRSKSYIYWGDIVRSIQGRRLSTTSGKVDSNFAENSVTFQPNGTVGNLNDGIGWNVEYNHEYLQVNYTMEDDTVLVPQLRPHIHWWQPADKAYQFTLRYRIQYNNTAKTTAWTTMTLDASTDSAFAYGGGIWNQISLFKNGSDENIVALTAGQALSAEVQFQMWRTDSESEDIDVKMIDVHAPSDRAGSEQEFVKEA